MFKGIRSGNNRSSGLLITGVLGIILGIGLLILSKAMLTDFTFSSAQTDRSNVVSYIGKGILILGLVIATACFVKRAAKDLLSSE